MLAYLTMMGGVQSLLTGREVVGAERASTVLRGDDARGCGRLEQLLAVRWRALEARGAKKSRAWNGRGKGICTKKTGWQK